MKTLLFLILFVVLNGMVMSQSVGLGTTIYYPDQFEEKPLNIHEPEFMLTAAKVS